MNEYFYNDILEHLAEILFKVDEIDEILEQADGREFKVVGIIVSDLMEGEFGHFAVYPTKENGDHILNGSYLAVKDSRDLRQANGEVQ
jgi:hypothetical protein